MNQAKESLEPENQEKVRRMEIPGYLESTESSSEIVNDIFYEAILCTEKALYASLQLQEDSLKVLGQWLSKAGLPPPVQKDLEALSTRVFPKARTHLDQMLEVSSLRIMLLNRASSQSASLMARASTLLNSSSVPEIFSKAEELARRMFKTFEDDSHIFFNTNLKILKICRELTDPRPILGSLGEPSSHRLSAIGKRGFPTLPSRAN